jgi:FkbM family methyltransferase
VLLIRSADGPAWRAGALAACLLLGSCGGAPAPREAPGSAAPSAAPHRDILGKKLAQKKQVYSQHNEELIIRDFFQDRRDGVFLDVGCAWPVKYSNTYFLEHELGWSGIGIDALPEYAEEWKRERPRSRFFNFLVTDHVAASEAFYRSDVPGISAVKPREVYSRKRVKSTEIEVPSITITKLLDDQGVKHVDLVSLDIEGAELQALNGFDIDRFRPGLVCVEWFHAGRDKLMAYFTAHGYERIERYLEFDTVNDYYTPKDGLTASTPD